MSMAMMREAEHAWFATSRPLTAWPICTGSTQEPSRTSLLRCVTGEASYFSKITVN